jgi:hypothetical protein
MSCFVEMATLVWPHNVRNHPAAASDVVKCEKRSTAARCALHCYLLRFPTLPSFATGLQISDRVQRILPCRQDQTQR